MPAGDDCGDRRDAGHGPAVDHLMICPVVVIAAASRIQGELRGQDALAFSYTRASDTHTSP